VFLDARAAIGSEFAARFPIIAAACRRHGVDPAREPMPVKPAGHYHMGGVAADAEGRSSVGGLWVCGEAASTGLHGANRLGSNSLTEAAVFSAIAAQSIESAPIRSPAPPRSFSPPPAPDPAAVRPFLSRAAGVIRDHETLRAAVRPLAALACSAGPAADPAAVALPIVVGALRREHSVGAHCRADFPERPAELRRRRITLDEALVEAAAIAPRHPAKRA
jgi:L-aspartate oxidase